MLTDHPYRMPLNFDLEAYVRDALVSCAGGAARVELLFDKATPPGRATPAVASKPDALGASRTGGCG